MISLGEISRIGSKSRLHNLLATEYPGAHQVYELFDEFLRHKTYNRSFCLKLLTIAKQRTKSTWRLRRLAVLMLEHQVLKLNPGELQEFDFLFVELNLKQTLGVSEPIVRSVLKEGYSTTDLQGFIIEFRCKLERLNHIHDKIKGIRTSATALQDLEKVFGK